MAASAIGWSPGSSPDSAGAAAPLPAGPLAGLGACAVLVLAPLGALAAERVLALADDVDLEVGAGDLGAHARGGLLVLVLLDVGRGLGRGCFSGGRLVSLRGGRLGSLFG